MRFFYELGPRWGRESITKGRMVMSNDFRKQASLPDDASKNDGCCGSLNRRNILLGGTTLIAASAFSTATSIKPAKAQVASKPNILIIWGDDIGGFL